MLGWGSVAYGGEVAGINVAGSKDAKITLEQAIAVVKQFIHIPEDYKNFQPGYSEGEREGGFWELQWNGDDSESGSINARVNAETGELWSMNQWKPELSGTTRHGLPKLSRAEAQLKAQDFLKKVLPNYINSLRIKPEGSDSFPYFSLREKVSPTHYFSFVRVVNGIPFPENSASVEVDGNTGEIRSFYFNWDSRAEFPKPDGLISSAQATDLWKKSALVQLAYYRSGDDEKDSRTRLVYEPKFRDLVIDAKSGEIIKPNEYADYYGFEAGMGGGGEIMKRSAAVSLTPAEQAAMTEMEKLISKEKALEIAASLIEIPEGYKLESSSLQQEYFSGQKIWYFNWRNKEDEGSLNVLVDAGQGQIIGFNLYGPNRENVGEPCLDEKQAREMASEFLNKVAGRYLGELEGLRMIPGPGPFPPLKNPVSESGKTPKPTSYSFVAERLVNGIPFRGNGTQIYVDAVRGKITSYRLNWWEMKFPEARGVISREQAEKTFLENGALTLRYQREYPKRPPELEIPPIRLVYSLDTEKAPNFIDPFTGLGLESDFQPKTGINQTVFSDLQGHPAAEAVNMLVKAKIIPVFDTNFRPDASLSQRDFLIWLVRAVGWRSGSVSSPDREFEKDYKQALRLGILKSGEQYLPHEDLSKLTLARLSVRALGWDEVAGLNGIWLLPVPPGGAVKQIPASDQGYLALALGLGVFSLSDRNFDPGAKLTRAEGALALYQLLK